MSSLDQLFYWRGIADSYHNYRGEYVQVPHEYRVNLLKAMGADLSDQKIIDKQAYDLDVAPWTKWMPSIIVSPSFGRKGFYLNVSPTELTRVFHWEVSLGGEVVKKGSFTPVELDEVGEYLYQGERYSRHFYVIKDLLPNYYSLTITDGEKSQTSILAYVPEMAFQPEWSERGERIWGTIIQLYTLRSDRNWGVGDFSDLKLLIEKTAAKGAGCIGLNPLHALLPDVSHNCSPYSPSDRRFINPLYIDPEFVEESRTLLSGESESAILFEELQKKAELLRLTDKVNYAEVKKLKYRAFELLFTIFDNQHIKTRSARAKEFLEYLQQEGEPLQNYAVWEATNNPFLTDHDFDQQVVFHCYLQWLAERQLEFCQQYALKQGMQIGLIRDLAVGADAGGAEVTSNPNLFCEAAAVGAPPDPFAQQGQNWGLPPMDPMHLRETGYAHYISLLRENMQHCGALRIDHAMSLMRLWWCPPGETADHGAYVYYSFEEMLGLLILESYLNRCAIIGEDLGVVPNEFREAIRRAKIFTNKVVYFEKQGNWFKQPENYESHALAMVDNHDVPTLVSWWGGSDLALRDQLNLLEEGISYEYLMQERFEDKCQIINMLKHHGLCPEHWQERDLNEKADQALVFAILKLSSKVASKFFVIQLEDLLLMEDPVNVPGTFKEYDNWQRKISVNIKTIFQDKNIDALLRDISEIRKS